MASDADGAARAAGGPGADASDTKKVQYDYEFSDACDHIWYFKRSFDDNGRGLVVFEGEKSEVKFRDFLIHFDDILTSK